MGKYDKSKVKWPEWFKEKVIKPYKADIAHTFILYGDISGLMQNPDYKTAAREPYQTLNRFLEGIFDKRELVIFYNVANGITFLRPDMETLFKNLVGLAPKASADSAVDPVAAAKAKLKAKTELPKEPDACLELMEKALMQQEKCTVIIQSVHFLAPANEMNAALSPPERANIQRLKNWGGNTTIRKNGGLILLISDQLAKVHEELKDNGSGTHAVLMPKPTPEEREAFIRALVDPTMDDEKKARDQILSLEKKITKMPDNDKRVEQQAKLKELVARFYENSEHFLLPQGTNVQSVVVATQGLNLQQIQDIFLECRAGNETIDLKRIKAKKIEILTLEYGDVMEVKEPQISFDDIGGMAHVKEYFRQVLTAMQNGELTLVPMGVTIMGPPGTGKSIISEALAMATSALYVKIKNLRTMWLGETERKAEKLELGLRALAPVIVENDEADLADAERDSPKGDAGVSNRIMRMWMTLLSDQKIRGKILIINITNRPNRLDPALKRSGRSDERILLPMPSDEERLAIFKVMFRKYKIPTEITDFTEFAERSNGLSGADIEKIALDAKKNALRREKKPDSKVTPEDLKRALANHISSSNQKEIDTMTLYGLLESSSRELLPKNAEELMRGIAQRGLVDNLPELLTQIADRKILVPIDALQ